MAVKQSALVLINKKYGKGTATKLGDKAKIEVPVISTGSLVLDLATGIGGIPKGRITEIYGPDASGKTTLSLHIIKNVQGSGEQAVFVDMEHALDIEYAKAIGVDTAKLYLSQPDYAEQALDVVEMFVKVDNPGIIVIDSVAALVPKAELEGEMGDAHMGLQARLMSQALRKLSGIVSKSNTAIVFINQVREKIGVVFGNPEVTTGGRALKFYASLRLNIRRTGYIKRGTVIIGNQTKVKIVKNKLAPPYREAVFNIIYGEGISYINDIIELASQYGIIEKSGSWYSYKGKRIGQGKEGLKNYLNNHEELMGIIEKEVKIKNSKVKK